MTRNIILAFFVCLAAAVVGFPAAAQQPEPTLTVSSAAGSVTYQRSDLEAMQQVTIETTTPWDEGVVRFEGVPLADLLAAANASGETATVTALNDYSVDVPTADFAQFGTILAIKRNGDYMPVDDKGPFFIIYPFDANPDLQRQPYYGRAVWQVKEISVH